MIFRWSAISLLEKRMGTAVCGISRGGVRPHTLEFSAEDQELALNMARKDFDRFKRYVIDRLSKSVRDPAAVLQFVTRIQQLLEVERLESQK